MISLRIDQAIAELLDDPLISLMIQADSVDRQALADDLFRLYRQISGIPSQAGAKRLPIAFGRAPPSDPIPLAHAAAAAATHSKACEGCVR
jgi:hypothetical protein